MNENYLKVEKFEIPLYRGKLIVIISNCVEEVQRIIPEFNPRGFYAHTYLFNYRVDKADGEEGYGLVFNFDHEDPPITPGVIAHESLHAVNMILDNRGVVEDFNNDEPVAYLLEWIVDRVYETMHKYNFNHE